jgi:hypothetical protein
MVSCSTVVASTSAGVLTNEPLNEVAIAVRTALTMTGLGMSSTLDIRGPHRQGSGSRNGISYRSADGVAELLGLRLVRCPLSTPAAGSSWQSMIAGCLEATASLSADFSSVGVLT